tara:strand:+ start:731 stop:964 length:234 start_codon:yes stop_codon:yes gene_type:complete
MTIPTYLVMNPIFNIFKNIPTKIDKTPTQYYDYFNGEIKYNYIYVKNPIKIYNKIKNINDIKEYNIDDFLETKLKLS